MTKWVNKGVTEEMRDQNYERIRRLMLATTRIDGAYYFFSRRAGIKENILVLLYAMDDGKPHSHKQICEDWLVPKTTINTNIRELKKAGYVKLFPGEGTREKKIGLTEAGMAFAQQILKSVYEAEETAIEKTLQKYSPEFADALDYFADCLCEELQKKPAQEG